MPRLVSKVIQLRTGSVIPLDVSSTMPLLFHEMRACWVLL